MIDKTPSPIADLTLKHCGRTSSWTLIVIHVQSFYILVVDRFEGLAKDSQKQIAAFVQRSAGIQEIGAQYYRDFRKVGRAVAGYGRAHVLLYM